MADISLKFAIPIIAVAAIPMAIANYSYWTTTKPAALETKTKSPYWEGSRKSDACSTAKNSYDLNSFRHHLGLEGGDHGGIFNINCTSVVFSGDKQEYASVDFNVSNGVRRWKVEYELKELSPGHWEDLGGREVNHRIATAH
jgi:hypothetical protein